jgi:penicillin amidase
VASSIKRNAALLLALLAMLPGCAALAPRAVGTDQRLAALPRQVEGLANPVTIRWNQHLVPWIEAESDTDLAYALGIVHGHLRGAQIEIMRKIARGRLAEIAGPLATDIDHALRILDFGKSGPAVEAAWPPETRAFVTAFLAGLNQVVMHGPRPPEAGLLGLAREPITAQDMLAVGRVAGTDINWLVLFSLLAERGTPAYEERWRRLREAGAGVSPQGALAAILTGNSRAGSNAVAVDAAHSTTGGALLASDPHLSLNLPNLWLTVGMRSPSYDIVGMMVPGLPVMGFGRNGHIAWGGTNLRSAASDVFDISALPPDQLRTRTETIRQRLWFDAEREVRDSPFGPVVSDVPLLKTRPGDVLALRWVGHEPTDEITALLRAAKARDSAEFRAAFDGFGVSPQNFLWADTQGHIGRITATVLPRRTGFPAHDPVLPTSAAAAWDRLWDWRDLPQVTDPPDGVLASANENPAAWAPNPPPVGYVFSDGDRVGRLRALLLATPRVSPADLAALQVDTLAPKAATLAAGLLARLDALPGGPPEPALLARLRGWNGDYAADAEAPLVFELLLGQLAPAIAAARGLRPETNWGALTSFLLRDLDALPNREALLRQATAAAAPLAAKYRTWGDIHRLRTAHWLVNLPLLGRRFVLGNQPVGGSRETPMKSGHGLVTGPHEVTFGSMARQVSDMADPDANWFTLWGGQDGWLGSAAFADQVPLWQSRQGIRMPLRPATIAAEFPTVTRLDPGLGRPR